MLSMLFTTKAKLFSEATGSDIEDSDNQDDVEENDYSIGVENEVEYEYKR